MRFGNANWAPLAGVTIAVVLTVIPGCGPPPPKAPVNLTVSPASSGSLTLTWQEGGGEERSFRVERKQESGYSEVASLPANTTRYEVKGLEPKHAYSYRVVAVGTGKHEAAGAESGATTLPLTLEEAVAAARPSVLLVRNKRTGGLFNPEVQYNFGTGFVITESRVVTNHHVVDGATEVAVRMEDSWYTAEVLASDDTNDLAILKVDHALPKPLDLADPDAVREGSALVAIGFPKVNDLASEGFNIVSSIAPGSLTAFRERKRDSSTTFLGVPMSVTCRLIQMDCPINPGNSGGPVLEIGSGRVVGVTVSRVVDAEGIKFAIPVEYVKELAARPVSTSGALGGGGNGENPFTRGSSLLGNRPSFFGNRPSFLGNGP